uniref:Huntingtin-associated protein 1 n=1 Tax=Varanus komodoensis TaxID=61221 RepID=A0A8D2Q728_VARKO
YDIRFWVIPSLKGLLNQVQYLASVSVCLPPTVLCSERVSRITKTYHDIDAVTSLLEEVSFQGYFCSSIAQALFVFSWHSLLFCPKIAQLRHEISMRDDLLHLYTNSTEESEPASAIPTPLRRNESALSLQQCFQYDALQQKLKALEEENQKLRTEVTSITTEMCHYEEQEQKLMIDCVEHREVVSLSEELARKVDDSARQQEEISQLLAQIVDLQQKCRTVMEELQQHLNAAKQGQQQLRTELQDLQEKYAECGAMLQEAQEEIKNLRNRSLPNSTIHRHTLYLLPLKPASILLVFRGYRRIFETVKAVKQAAKAKSWAESPLTLPPGSPKPSSLGCSRISTPHSSYYGSDMLYALSGGLCDSRNICFGLCSQGEPGTSGIPGQHDLEAALQCLSARQENHSTERSFFEVERERKLRHLARDAEDSSGFLTPNESITSTGTNYSGSSGGSGFSLSSFSYFPDKLQIIKPLEGSMTLHHWQQLAQPHLAGILDPRPGVLTKDFRQLDTDLEEVYNLNDLEEDEVDVTSFPALSTSTPSKAKGGPSGEWGKAHASHNTKCKGRAEPWQNPSLQNPQASSRAQPPPAKREPKGSLEGQVGGTGPLASWQLRCVIVTCPASTGNGNSERKDRFSALSSANGISGNET